MAAALLAAAIAAEAPTFAQAPDTLYLKGTIRDISKSHPDFNITNPAVMDHYVHNVASILSQDGRPIFTGGGTVVTTQWMDQFGNPIMPYIDTSTGLPGGHFDVDVFKRDKDTMKKAWHKHEFDDAYNTNYIDILNDEKFLLDDLVLGNPNDVRVEFFNDGNGGGGTFEFKTSGGPMQNGSVAGGFTYTFSPSELTKFRVDFYSLLLLRQSSPKIVQGDQTNRDGAFSVRIYDVVSNALIYELSVYTHVKDGDITPPPPPPPPDEDSCGVPLNDTEGSFGSSGAAGVTNDDSFYSWFHDSLGTNLSKHHTIELPRDGDGVYEYCTAYFYPIDGLLLGNEGDDHNNFFTYSIAASFTYDACSGQFFEFKGNDDAWVFVDNHLVIDLGGAGTLQRQRVDLDRLDLTDGERYTLNFFYAHRWPSLTSLFCMRTNIVLETGIVGTVSQSFD